MTEPIPGLNAANAARAEHGALRQIGVLAEFFEGDDTEGATLEMLEAGRARLEHPDDSLAQIAERCGLTRDAYASRLQRLLGFATRVHARRVLAARQDPAAP